MDCVFGRLNLFCPEGVSGRFLFWRQETGKQIMTEDRFPVDVVFAGSSLRQILSAAAIAIPFPLIFLGGLLVVVPSNFYSIVVTCGSKLLGACLMCVCVSIHVNGISFRRGRGIEQYVRRGGQKYILE